VSARGSMRSHRRARHTSRRSDSRCCSPHRLPRHRSTSGHRWPSPGLPGCGRPRVLVVRPRPRATIPRARKARRMPRRKARPPSQKSAGLQWRQNAAHSRNETCRTLRQCRPHHGDDELTIASRTDQAQHDAESDPEDTTPESARGCRNGRMLFVVSVTRTGAGSRARSRHDRVRDLLQPAMGRRP
jgi:hypothetical protein